MTIGEKLEKLKTNVRAAYAALAGDVKPTCNTWFAPAAGEGLPALCCAVTSLCIASRGLKEFTGSDSHAVAAINHAQDVYGLTYRQVRMVAAGFDNIEFGTAREEYTEGERACYDAGLELRKEFVT